jgi:RsmE family RNA methyltransferase
MNILLFKKEECHHTRLLLRDHRARHVVKVLQSQPGDTVRVGEIQGKMGTGTVLRVERKYPFEVDLDITLHARPPAPPAIDLLLALPRPIMLKRILSQVTALGIGTIHLVNANRVEKSFWESGILKEEEYLPHLLQGLEQAVDTRLPKIIIHPRFRPFVEDCLPEIRGQYTSLLLAHPYARHTLGESLHAREGRVLYTIGPEGGWVDFEVEKFMEAGLQSFQIGSRILKVDTAVVAIHGRISELLEQ